MKASRISRVVQILTTLQAGKSYAAGDLAKIFGLSRRTVFRDLKELQSIGIPYHYDATAGGYRMDPEFFLPPVDLSLREALSLLLLVHKARSQIQLPFKNSALLAALKIENNLPVKIRQYCNRALQNISTKANAQALTRLLDRMFVQLQNAISRKCKVGIRYHSLFEDRITDVTLSPYHLLYNRRAWYVVGFSSLHKGIRTFKFNRIKDLKLLDEYFIDGDDFDLYEYLGRAWSMIPEGRIYNIKLRFLPKVASNVSEVQWHNTQQVTRNRDGSATIEFRIDGLGEITWWILGYGNQVQVLAPKVLRNRIIEMAENIVEINRQVQKAP
ncbi:MAG: helix-turn-helix transcriptional regulator [Planctomycetota bacterium]